MTSENHCSDPRFGEDSVNFRYRKVLRSTGCRERLMKIQNSNLTLQLLDALGPLLRAPEILVI